MLKNFLAILAGIIVGSIVNMSIVMLGFSLVPPPEGVNIMDPNGMSNSIHLFEFKHFIFPFLAHALGTLVGAFTAVKIGASHHMRLAFVIGFFFLFGGIQAILTIGGPLWFKVVDLVFAYTPMAWLGGNYALKNKS